MSAALPRARFAGKVAVVALPSLLLAGFGVAVWLIRRNQKRAFLASLNR